MRSRLPLKPPRLHGPTPALARWLRRLVQIARLFVFACALQLSGATHALVGLLGGADVACVDTCDCADDPGEGEHGCPLDCPDCACPHGRLPSLPPEVAAALPARVTWELLQPWTPYRSGAPPSPPHASLERPPRA